MTGVRSSCLASASMTCTAHALTWAGVRPSVTSRSSATPSLSARPSWFSWLVKCATVSVAEVPGWPKKYPIRSRPAAFSAAQSGAASGFTYRLPLVWSSVILTAAQSIAPAMGCHWDGRPWKLATSTPGSVIAEVLSLPAAAQTRTRGADTTGGVSRVILAGSGRDPGVSFRHFARNWAPGGTAIRAETPDHYETARAAGGGRTRRAPLRRRDGPRSWARAGRSRPPGRLPDRTGFGQQMVWRLSSERLDRNRYERTEPCRCRRGQH